MFTKLVYDDVQSVVLWWPMIWLLMISFDDAYSYTQLLSKESQPSPVFFDRSHQQTITHLENETNRLKTIQILRPQSVVGEMVLLVFLCWSHFTERAWPSHFSSWTSDHPHLTTCCAASLSTPVLCPAGFVWPLLWHLRRKFVSSCICRWSFFCCSSQCFSSEVKLLQLFVSLVSLLQESDPQLLCFSRAPFEPQLSHQWDLCWHTFSSTSWTLALISRRAFANWLAFSCAFWALIFPCRRAFYSFPTFAVFLLLVLLNFNTRRVLRIVGLTW